MRRAAAIHGPLAIGALAVCWLFAVPARRESAAQAQAPPAQLFRDITRDSGVTFQHHADPEKKYIVESMSGGLALFDFDNDGLLDIYFVDSLTVETAGNPRAARSTLYRNRGKGRFDDVTDKAGVGHPGWGMGVCTADVDGDGWEDLYVTALGGNKYYRNNRDGTFADLTAAAGLTAGGWSAGCGFADYDRDGDLDLFVARYVRIDLANLPQFGKDKTCDTAVLPCSVAREGCRASRTSCFGTKATGSSRMSASTQACRIRASTSDSASAGSTTTRMDGWTCTWRTTRLQTTSITTRRMARSRRSRFRWALRSVRTVPSKAAWASRLATTTTAAASSVWVTNFSEEYNALYRNNGDHFTDTSFQSKTAAVSLPFVGWGNAFFDYDNDGLLDMIVVNGHVYPQLDKARLRASAGYRQRKLLFHNRGNGTFDEVGPTYGQVIMEERVSRGLAVGDLDNDGRLDVVINDLDGSPQLLRNEIDGAGYWLSVKLRGKGLNTGAIGAVVTARIGGAAQKRLVQSGSSYISQEDKRLHFGLGKAAAVTSLEVRWPDGTTTMLADVKTNQILEVRQ